MKINTYMKVHSRKKVIKWIVVALLLSVVIIGNYFYLDCSLPLRILVVILMISIAGSVVIITNQSKFIVNFAREARTEIRKVIWPNCQITLQTTVIVAAVTTIMSLILWWLDSILVYLVALTIGLRF